MHVQLIPSPGPARPSPGPAPAHPSPPQPSPGPAQATSNLLLTPQIRFSWTPHISEIPECVVLHWAWCAVHQRPSVCRSEHSLPLVTHPHVPSGPLAAEDVCPVDIRATRPPLQDCELSGGKRWLTGVTASEPDPYVSAVLSVTCRTSSESRPSPHTRGLFQNMTLARRCPRLKAGAGSPLRPRPSAMAPASPALRRPDHLRGWV